LELNASDERGIQVVRDKIKKYSQKLVSKISDRNSPNFQIVILDEADSMTTDAQSALRRIIEDHTKNTRFCFICNYVSKIIDPIASRCAKYRFSPLTKETQMARLKFISINESLPVDEDVLKFLIDISEGDLRRSINLLQSISQLGQDLMTQQIINDVCGIIPNSEIENLFETARFQNTEIIMKEANNFFHNGYDLRQLLIQLNDLIMGKSDLTDSEKISLCDILLDCETNLLEGSSPNLKLYNLMTEIRKIFSMH
jgi:replication factor C subunit 2/4